MLNPPVNGNIQGLFKAFESLSSTFKANLIFKDFARQSHIFKYFSSLCEPCLYADLNIQDSRRKIMHLRGMVNEVKILIRIISTSNQTL